MSSLPPPRRIVLSNLPLPSKLASIDGAQPRVQVVDERLASTPEIKDQFARSTVFTHESIPTSNKGLVVEPKEGLTGGGIIIPRGANIRFNDIAPGCKVPMHRTSTTDYNIFIQGSVTLITPDEAYDPKTGQGKLTQTVCNPGDVVMMRGALHAWENHTKEWTRSLSVILGAEATTVDVEETQEVRVLPDCFLGARPRKVNGKL